ncbi:MAG: hypothetical protein IPM83_11435 [Ignavibacteria bacterium]|nr:hypothetical protein [Ignavibacteria bacterium]
MIFQDPYSSLNARLSVKQIIAKPVEIHTEMSKQQVDEKVDVALGTSRTSTRICGRYPHEFLQGDNVNVSALHVLATNLISSSMRRTSFSA